MPKNFDIPLRVAEGDSSQNPDKMAVYRAATAMVKAGLSVIPISADGSKKPAFELLTPVWSETECRYKRPWSGFKTRPATPAELRNWFRDSAADRVYGIGVIGGAVSGGLEIVDLDSWDFVEPWSALVNERAPGLLDRLVRVKSPRPGLHVYYRCREYGGNQKLARIPEQVDGAHKPKTVIELKGAAGYCVAPPSPPACHRSNRPYTYDGELDLTCIPTIEPEEREVLLTCARRLDAWVRAPRSKYSPKTPKLSGGGFLRPGDEFNASADWGEILLPHGWTWVGKNGEESDHWCRPGKRDGVSATTGFAESGLMFVFSTNAEPFEAEEWYTKFRAYTLLNHGGDFGAAARALARLGYGGSPSSKIQIDPLERYSDYVVRSWKNQT